MSSIICLIIVIEKAENVGLQDLPFSVFQMGGIPPPPHLERFVIEKIR